MSETMTLPDKIVCDGYGIGNVESIFKSNVRGFEEDFIKINFPAIKMTYSLPLQKLIYRELSKPSIIKNLFKENVVDKVKTLSKLNFNVQQMKMHDMTKTGSIEDVVFLLRYLDCKKRNSVTNSLCGFDDSLYRKLVNNLAEELGELTEQTTVESISELKKLLDKNQVKIQISEPNSFAEDEDEDNNIV